MHRKVILTLLAGILLVGAGSLSLGQRDAPAPTQDWLIGFLVLMPVGLALLIWWELRWAAMACVIYATVGLALDLATTVQILTKDTDGGLSLASSLISGLLNFLVILFAGRSFLQTTPAPPPQGSRPPNPPAPT